MTTLRYGQIWRYPPDRESLLMVVDPHLRAGYDPEGTVEMLLIRRDGMFYTETDEAIRHIGRSAFTRTDEHRWVLVEE